MILGEDALLSRGPTTVQKASSPSDLSCIFRRQGILVLYLRLSLKAARAGATEQALCLLGDGLAYAEQRGE